MQKRTDRNKSLYERIDREIEKVANKNSNKEFQSTNETLKNIDPELFGGDIKQESKPSKINPQQKKILTTGFIFLNSIVSVFEKYTLKQFNVVASLSLFSDVEIYNPYPVLIVSATVNNKPITTNVRIYFFFILSLSILLYII